VSQSAVFPDSEATAVTLRFFLRAGFVQHSGDDDSVRVRVDGLSQAVFPEPAAAEAAYSERTVDLLPFADGGTHTVTFESVAFAGTTFNVDDISLDVVCGAPLVEPIGLSVDPLGNNVLEPLEAALVRPSWRNNGPAPAALVGTASNFTGPAGPVYTLIDSSASYGTIAPGLSAECTDCYQLGVGGMRPLQHWDAMVLETPAPLGSAKTWTLHVGNSFTDVPPANPFYRFVEALFHKGITSGCGTDIYCPSSSTSREQMSVFVLVAKEGSGYSPPACAPPNTFGDVPETSPFCRFIEELASRGVVSGCGGGNYCPMDPVSREQMAVFVLATLDPTLSPPPCTTPIFGDVPTISPFCRWIEELARRGVVTGCGGGNYCPADPVTREQMGVFITETFSLRLYAP
jgi:hypothetical protein